MHASPIAALGSGENGGMNVYIRAVCEELSQRGIPTEIFTRRSSPDGLDRIRLAEHSWVTQLRVGPAASLGKDRLFDLLPAFTEAVLAERNRRRVRYSLVHSHYWLSGWVASRLRDEWKLPWFHTFHTLARVKNERAADGAVLEPDHRIAVEQSVVRNSDRLIASSVQEAEDLVRLYSSLAEPGHCRPARGGPATLRPAAYGVASDRTRAGRLAGDRLRRPAGAPQGRGNPGARLRHPDQ